MAVRIDGTVVHDVCRPRGLRKPIPIGHPSGALGIIANVTRADGRWRVNEVLFSRTARRLMDGTAHLRRSHL